MATKIDTSLDNADTRWDVIPKNSEGVILPQRNKRSTSKFFPNFDIPDNSFWTPEYMHKPETVDCLVQQYTEYKARISIAYANADNERYFDGYSVYHIQRYLLETLVGEGNIEGSTSLDNLEKYLREPDDSIASLKINNLKNAMDKLFPNVFEFVSGKSNINVENLTADFIKDLHKQVMGNLVDEPGAYRTRWAAPSQENWMYLVPEKISENLDALCVDLRKQFEDDCGRDSGKDSLVTRIKIVASFFSQLLQIHPFTNGNGRVARLLISWLMADVSVVPVPLFTTFDLRKIYLDCLRDSRRFDPGNMARFIFECVIKTVRTACVSLDI